jgi:hypothetical protein
VTAAQQPSLAYSNAVRRYVTVGAICVLLGGLFLAKHMISPRKLGDQKYLVWKQ